MTLIFGRPFKDIDTLNPCYQSTLMVGYGYPRYVPDSPASHTHESGSRLPKCQLPHNLLYVPPTWGFMFTG